MAPMGHWFNVEFTSCVSWEDNSSAEVQSKIFVEPTMGHWFNVEFTSCVNWEDNISADVQFKIFVEPTMGHWLCPVYVFCRRSRRGGRHLRQQSWILSWIQRAINPLFCIVVKNGWLLLLYVNLEHNKFRRT